MQETAESLQSKLDDITELPESDSYPLFHLLPEVLQHWKNLLLLPLELKHFLVESRTAEACLKMSKEITIAAYTNARRMLGDAKAVVCVPPKELLQVQPSRMKHSLTLEATHLCFTSSRKTHLCRLTSE